MPTGVYEREEVDCPDCDRHFGSLQALGRHRGAAHKAGAKAAETPKPPALRRRPPTPKPALVAAPISVVDRLEPPDAPPVPRAGSPFDEVLRMAQVAGVQLITDHLQAWVAEQLAAMEN